MPELCGLPSVGFLFALLLISAALESVTRFILEEMLGWNAPPNATAEEIRDHVRHQRLVASTLSVLLGIAVCWIFGIGILQWLKIGTLDSLERHAADYIFTGIILGGGTRVVSALLKSWGLLPSFAFERKRTTQSANARQANSNATIPQVNPHSAELIARLIEVETLPGFLTKSLVVPPTHAGVVYAGGVASKALSPGTQTIRGIGALEPVFVALVDMSELTLTPIVPNLPTADEPVDWTFRLRTRVTDPVRFAARVLGDQSRLDRRGVGNYVAGEILPTLRSAVSDYDAGALFDSSVARANILRQVISQAQQICSDSGLEMLDFASVDFTPAMSEQALEQLEQFEGAAGKVEIEQQVKAHPEAEQVVSRIEAKTGATNLLTPEETQAIKSSLANPSGQTHGIALMIQAIERRLAQMRQRIEDRIEQLWMSGHRSTKVDRFLQRNANLLSWAKRLKLLGSIIVSTITIAGIVDPQVIPDNSAFRLGAAGVGLVAAVASFLGSLYLGSEYNRRKSEYDQGRLNRLSLERVLGSDATLRASIASELDKLTTTLRDERNQLVTQRKELAIQMRDVEEKASRLRQEISGAETGTRWLQSDEHVTGKQAQRLMDLEDALLHDIEQMTKRGLTLVEPIRKADWSVVAQAVSDFNSKLTELRNRFINRTLILRGK